MSIIGLSMAALLCCAEEDAEARSAALRVDWPVYPPRAEHNTVAEGGNRRWAETARQNAASALNTADCGARCGGAGVLEERALQSSAGDGKRLGVRGVTAKGGRKDEGRGCPMGLLSSVAYQADFLARMVTAIIHIEAISRRG